MSGIASAAEFMLRILHVVAAGIKQGRGFAALA